MTWQDLYFATASIFYTLVLIPSMVNPATQMPRSTTVTTAVVLTCSGSVYLTLGMPFASISTYIGALAYAYLAAFRPVKALRE